ncbi:MAG: FAD-dependent oxidoreductase [Verrucomicrobia bacterium]|nr:FAD-dependent oxidoreductase [Verrucomicrobiota bacterium]
MDYDVLIIGAGIAGMEAALSLGNMGFKVLLVEKEASIGGKMILLSKVFPTLDCASCISTPKMADVAHHPNVTLQVYSEVEGVDPLADGSFRAKVVKKPTYVNADLCTGCGLCETACTVAVADEFNAGLVARRAAHIPFPQAIPKKAVIDRRGFSPCHHSCPAGVRAHGYISLVRSGRYEEAFNLHMEDAPLVGSLARACYAPCEEECTRGSVDGTIPIRGIKRFMSDYYYERHPEPEYGVPEKKNGRKVAVIGAGPAGLTAAYQLARKGYTVKIFEEAPEAGGMLRIGIPSYRLPKDVVDRDIANVTALGVEIETRHEISSIEPLKEQGYDAVFLAAGAVEARTMGVEGEDLEGVMDCMEFLREVNIGRAPDLEGKTVMVVGGGNSAIDPARVAIRLGAEKVLIQYRRSRAEMPAHSWEIEGAEEEGVELQLLRVPVRFIGKDGKLEAAECISMKLGEPDESGRRSPVPQKGSEEIVPVDLVVLAIGLKPSTSPFAHELETNKNGTLKVNSHTLETSDPRVFAGGDVVTGPSMIAQAIGQGNRAAHHIDMYLRGEDLSLSRFDLPIPTVEKKDVLMRAKSISFRKPTDKKELEPSERCRSFSEIEQPFTKEEIRYGAGRCLDCAVCSECEACIRACPVEDCIRFDMLPERREVTVGSVIVATGYDLFNVEKKPQYGSGRLKNVITGMQMDRLLAPTRPFNTVLRPSDGKEPDNIAYVLCTGSRDQTADNTLCSRVCCMYSIKQAQLIMGALPLADITIYYIDIRAFGKGYDEFYEQAKAMGVYFVKGKVAKVEEAEDGNMTVFYEDMANSGGLKTATHDLVVLSVGLLPNREALGLFPDQMLKADDFHYVAEVEEDIDPGRTSIAGVFVAGTASGARDIPDSILHAGAAAAQAAAYIENLGVRS